MQVSQATAEVHKLFMSMTCKPMWFIMASVCSYI